MNEPYDGPRLVSDRPTSDDAAVARLLRLAGHRPAVPARAAEIVKQAARAQWMGAVTARRRSAFMVRGGGGLLAAAALALMVLNTDLRHRVRRSFAQPVATVAATAGRVLAPGPWVVKPGAVARGAYGSELVELEVEDGLLPGAVVETGAGGLALRLADGTSLRLDVESRLRILAGNKLELEGGAVYADSGPGGAASAGSLEIHTPLGVASDIGTQFEVRLDDALSSLKLRVREGTVVLEREGGKRAVSASVRFGAELTVPDDCSEPKPDGCGEPEVIARYGPSWNWVLEVLPPFEVENPSVHEILVWATREYGWQLSYADKAARKMTAVVLEGWSAEGLTPEDAAVGAVVAGGLDCVREDGVFLVTPRNEGSHCAATLK